MVFIDLTVFFVLHVKLRVLNLDSISEGALNSICSENIT